MSHDARGRAARCLIRESVKPDSSLAEIIFIVLVAWICWFSGSDDNIHLPPNMTVSSLCHTRRSLHNVGYVFGNGVSPESPAHHIRSNESRGYVEFKKVYG